MKKYGIWYMYDYFMKFYDGYIYINIYIYIMGKVTNNLDYTGLSEKEVSPKISTWLEQWLNFRMYHFQTKPNHHRVMPQWMLAKFFSWQGQLIG